MTKPRKLGLILIGFFGGAVVGAVIFALSGSMDLGRSFALIGILAIIGGIVGSQAPKILNWIKPEVTQESEDLTISQEETADFWVHRWQTLSESLPKEYSLDTVRFSVSTAIFVLLGLGFGYVEMQLGQGQDVPIFFLFAIGCFAIGIYHLARWILNYDLKVVLTSSDIQYASIGDRWRVGWDEVEKVWERHQKFSINMIPVQNTHQLRLLTRDGKAHRLDRKLRNFEDLAEIFQTAVAAHKMPQALRVLHRGETIDFDKFWMTNEGIGFKDRFLPWQDVKIVIIDNARIQVRKVGKDWFNWSEAQAWEVANFPLFVTLLEQFVKVKR